MKSFVNFSLVAYRIRLRGNLRGDRVADGVHEVGLAQADAAVQEQRVVGVARALGDAQGGGVGQAVGAMPTMKLVNV